MQYRYYILRFFLALTLVVGVKGAWGQILKKQWSVEQNLQFYDHTNTGLFDYRNSYPDFAIEDTQNNVLLHRNQATSFQVAGVYSQIFKFDPNGKELWKKEFRSNITGKNLVIQQIVLDISNNIYALFIDDEIPNIWRRIIRKIDQNGNVIWSKTLQQGQSSASDGYDSKFKIFIDNNGNINLVFTAGGYIKFDDKEVCSIYQDGYDLLSLIKVSPNGQLIDVRGLTPFFSDKVASSGNFGAKSFGIDNLKKSLHHINIDEQGNIYFTWLPYASTSGGMKYHNWLSFDCKPWTKKGVYDNKLTDDLISKNLDKIKSFEIINTNVAYFISLSSDYNIRFVKEIKNYSTNAMLKYSLNKFTYIDEKEVLEYDINGNQTSTKKRPSQFVPTGQIDLRGNLIFSLPLFKGIEVFDISGNLISTQPSKGWFCMGSNFIYDIYYQEGIDGFSGKKFNLDKYSFTINTIPLVPDFSFIPTTTQVNQSITFKDESTGSPTSWAWDFGDGTTSTQQNPTKTYTKAGTYTVKLTINKQGATAANTTKSITITAETATLTLSASTRNVPLAGEQGGLNISTNTNWTAGSNAAWLKVNSNSGNAGTNIPVNYTVDANTATAARTGIITFTAGTQTATFTVTQAGVAPSLSVSPTAPASIAASGSTAALSVVSNLSWAVTKSANSDWLTISPASGTGNQNVSATAFANATTAERSATLTFSAASVANVVVTIRQAGVNASLSLSETSIKVNASPISIGILKLTTNTAWIAQSDAEWLTIGPASGNAGTNIELTWSVAINNSVSSRTGKITVMAGTQTATFTVTQAGINPEFSLSAESKTVAATGESGQLGITSNVPWSAASNAAWFTFSPANGGIGVINNFRYSVEANPNTTPRTGVISFSAGGLTKAFTVTQEGTKPTPPQAPTQLTVTATSESELRISWKDNANNETAYELERADGQLLGPTNSDFKKMATLPANTTTFLDQKLTSKSQYCYRVRAVNAVGASEFMQAVCGTTNAPPAGITLMVHGFNPSDEADFKENFAVIAQAIKERAGAGATVYTNDPTKGTWRKWELVKNNGNGDPTKEIILFYNWAVASNNELLRLENLRNNLRYMSNSGYLEGSADILFAMLADAQLPILPNNLLTTTKPLHFIGHSRGTVLLLQLMHRMAKWFPNVKIDHYTALDPHPATTMGDVVRQQGNTYSSLPLISGIASNCTATIGCSSASSGFDEIKIRIPENVAKAEVYYRKDGDYEDADKVLENILQAYLATPFSLSAVVWNLYANRYDKLASAFDGVSSIGGVNHQLDNTKISMGNTGGLGGAHSGVVSWYFGTIDTRLTTNDEKPISYDGEPLYLNAWYGTTGALLASKPAREKSGYYFSRIGGGYAQLADATEKVNLAEMDRQLSIRPREGNADGGMKLGIQNGNFEYNNDSGWKYGGGSSSASIVFKDGKAQGKVIKNETQPFALTHSLMFFQSTVNYLQINTLKTTPGSTKISIQFLNRDLDKIGQAITFEIPVTDAKIFVKIPASLKGKSGSFSIEGSGIALEKVELSDRSGSLDFFVELLAQPETPQATESLYEIFPNPNNGRFSLTSQDAQVPAISLVVVDVMGNVIFKATDNQLSVFNARQKLDIALPSGFTGSYTLRVETVQGVSFKRIIKE